MQNPAKIGGRNSSFASFDLGVGVQLRGSTPQPDAQARSRGRNTRITRANFRGVFSCSGWVRYGPHRKRDELRMIVWGKELALPLKIASTYKAV